MKKKIYRYRSHKLNRQNPSAWLCERGFVVCQSTDFLTGAGIRRHKMWENSWTQKKSKIDSLLFQDKCKKNYPYSGYHRVSVERQSFLKFQWNFVNEMMNIWMLYIKIAGWRNKSIEDHDRLTDHDSRKPIARVFPASFFDSPINLAPGPRR